MSDKKEYGIRNIRKVSRYCYYAGLGTGFIGLACILFIIVLHIPITEMIPPCTFHTVTGYYCPGCGGTRAVLAFLHGNILASVCYHPFVPYAAIYYIIYEGSHTLELITHSRIRGLRFCPMYFYIGIGLIILQWLGKNYFETWYRYLR